MKLLVVDDEVVTREYIKYVLREKNINIEIFEASNGLEAIEKVKSIVPDLVLIDIRMPIMDGLEVTKRIRPMFPTMKIAVLTAYDEFKYAQRALRLNVNEYLLKPISPDKLIDFISRNMRKEINEENHLIKPTILFQYEKELLDNIRFKENKKAKKAIGYIFVELTKVNLSLDKIKKYMLELIGIVERLVISLGLDINMINEIKYNKQKELLELDSLQLIKSNIESFIESVLTLVEYQYLSPKELSVIKAKSFVENNYNNKIYLKDVAKHVGFSPYYFSRLFKEIEGVNFSDYVNRYRIDMSKKYMQNFKLSLSQISEKVGYEDFSYFSSVFKKYENILPSKYRQVIKSKKQNNYNR